MRPIETNHPELGAHVLPKRPVDSDVVSDGPSYLPRDGAQGLVTENLDGTVVRLKGIVEGPALRRKTLRPARWLGACL